MSSVEEIQSANNDAGKIVALMSHVTTSGQTNVQEAANSVAERNKIHAMVYARNNGLADGQARSLVSDMARILEISTPVRAISHAEPFLGLGKARHVVGILRSPHL